MRVKRKRREINVKERKKMVGTNEGLRAFFSFFLKKRFGNWEHRNGRKE